MKNILRKLGILFAQGSKSRFWRGTAMTLACTVIFVTTYAMILPAITIEQDVAENMPGVFLTEDEQNLMGEEEFLLDEEEFLLDEEGGDVALELNETEDEISDSEVAAGEEQTVAGEEEAEEPAVQDGSEEEHATQSEGESEENAEPIEQGAAEENGKEEQTEQSASSNEETAQNPEEGLVIEEEIVVENPLTDPEVQEEITKYPAVTMSGNTDELDVLVEAPKGALPEGTAMQLTPVDGATIFDQVQASVVGKKVTSILAVDITFEQEGQKIQPAIPVKVTLQKREFALDVENTEADAQKYNHLETAGELEPEEFSLDPEEGEITWANVQEEAGKEEAATFVFHVNEAGEAAVVAADAQEYETYVFEADEFSVYAIVGTETITVDYLTADGKTYTITVTFDEREELSNDMELIVSEINEDTESFARYLDDAKAAMGLTEEDEVTLARFFDITIKMDGQKFEPVYPTTVAIGYKEAIEIGEDEALTVVHFAESGTEVIGDEEITISDDNKEIVYEQNSFSITGTIVAMTGWNKWPPAGNYLLAVKKDDNTYIVDKDGNLLPVTMDDAGKITIDSIDSLVDLNSENYIWALSKTGSVYNLKNGSNYLYPSKATGLSTSRETKNCVSNYNNGSVGDQKGLSVSNTNYMFDRMFQDTSAWNTTYVPRYLGINAAGTKLTGNQTSRTTQSYLVRSIHVDGEEYTLDDLPTFEEPTDVDWDFERSVYDTDIINTLKAPDTKKILTDNSDGTYDLTLSITGQSAAASDVNKVDVVVVIDRSTSMNVGNRLRSAVDAAKAIGTTDSLFQNSGVQISVIDFDTTVGSPSQWYTSDQASQYQSYVESLSGTIPNNHYTNWQQALKAAGNRLMDGRDDAYKYVIFLTDGNPTVYGTNGDQYGGTEGPGKDNDENWGTCTNAALPYAQKLIKEGAALYVVGCGEATNAYTFTARAYYGESYDQMSGAPAGRYLDASDDTIGSAFASVAEEIIASFTYADVAFNDGITTDYTATTLVEGNVSAASIKVIDKNGNDVTSTEGQYVSVDYTGGNAKLSFKYVKASGGTTLAAGEITEGTGENAGKFYDEAGDQVVPYTLKDGYSYSATFQVWPKQEAMDRIAELNNGAAYTEADEEKGIVSDGNGGYTLNTNTHATLTYKTVTTVEGEDPVYSEVKTVDNIPCLDEEGNPASIELVTSGMYFQKLWHVGLDTSQFTKMYDWSYDDGEEPLLHLEYTDSTGVHEKTFVIMPIHDNQEETSEGSGIYRTMRERYSIAPGIMVATLPTGATAKVTWTTTSGQTYYVLETGHDYRLIEDEVYYNYEKLDEIYHPMILGDKMYNVKVSGTTITDMEVMDPELLTADNYLLSGINIVKKVQDASGTDVSSDNTTFYVKLTIKDKDGAEYTLPENYTQQQKWDFPIWYNEYSAYTTDSETGMISGVGNWTKDDIWQSGEVKEIKVGQLLQLKNVPYGAIVTIQEVDASGNVISTGSINNGYKLVSIEGGNIASVDYNTSYNAVITNQQTSKDVTFKKLKAGTTDEYLDGAKFKLLRVEGTTQTLVNDLSGMDDSGVFSIENGSTGVTYALAPGEYVLVEADPPQGGYIKLVSGVYFTVGNSVTMTTEKQEVDGVETEVPITAEKYAKPDMADENGLTLLIYNEQGAELPSTGGPGTILYTLSGLALMLVAALMYGFRMRRRERRLQ